MFKATGILPELKFYNILLAAAGRAKKPERVFELLQEMQDKGIEMSTSVFEAAVIALGSGCKQPKVAYRVYRMLTEKNADGKMRAIPDRKVLNALVESFTSAGDVVRALGLVSELKHFHRVAPGANTYKIIVGYYLSRGELEKGFGVLNRMVANGMIPTVGTIEMFKHKATKLKEWREFERDVTLVLAAKIKKIQAKLKKQMKLQEKRNVIAAYWRYAVKKEQDYLEEKKKALSKHRYFRRRWIKYLEMKKKTKKIMQEGRKERKKARKEVRRAKNKAEQKARWAAKARAARVK